MPPQDPEPLANPDDLIHLWHYTNPAAIIGICETRTLLAGYPLDMNDRREQHVAPDHCISYLTSQGRRASNFLEQWVEYRAGTPGTSWHRAPFIISFTAARDSLVHWMTYANAYGGMGIGFTQAHLVEAGRLQPYGSFELHKVLYNESAQRALCDELTEKALTNYEEAQLDGTREAHGFIARFDAEVARLGSTMKDPAFEIEQEWRLVSPVLGMWPTEAMAFRPSARGIREYVKFDIWAGHPEGEPRPGIAFNLGPNGDTHANYRATEGLANKLGLTEIGWEQSTSPYRN